MAQRAAARHPGSLRSSLQDGAAGIIEDLVRGVRRRADRLELRLAARRVARDPQARASLEQMRARLADGSIHRELADQPDIWDLIREHRG